MDQGLFKSTLHRVVNLSRKERFSIAFFFDPNYDALVEPLPSCVTTENPLAFKPVMAGKRKLAKFEATWANLEKTSGWDEDSASLFDSAEQRSAESRVGHQ